MANGVLIGLFRIQPFIVTLGMLYMIAGAAMVYSGGSSLFGLPQPDVDTFFWFGGGFVGPIPVPLIIAAVLIAISHLLLTRVPIGRAVYAVGGNEQVALMSGIDVGSHKRGCRFRRHGFRAVSAGRSTRIHCPVSGAAACGSRSA